MNSVRRCAIAGCGREHYARGWCNKHYAQWRKTGDPLFRKPSRIKSVIELISSYDGDDCVLWPFARNSQGYPQARLNGKTGYVHTAICERSRGPKPEGQYEVAHSCGNGHLGCCTPSHLRWATPRENQADRIAHGTTNRGERSGHHKLTEESVLFIRKHAGILSAGAMAGKFGVCQGQIHAVIARRAWRWL